MHALPNCADADALEATLRQIRVMRCYATESGKPINEDLAAALALLATLCRTAPPPADGEPPAEEPAERAEPAKDRLFRGQPEDYETAYRLSLEVHRQLATLVHPATPATIVSTDFTWRIWRPKTVRPLQWVLMAIALLTLAATVTFTITTFGLNVQANASSADRQVTTDDVPEPDPPHVTSNPGGGSPKPANPSATTTTQPPPNTANDPAPPDNSGDPETTNRNPGRQLWLQFFAAAMVGAGFATLLNAAPFVVHRSFDNRYITVYLLRYLLGIVAGVILGFVGPELVRPDKGAPPEGLARLSVGVLAIVGGFSANAVAAILTRISETLVALVRGRNDAPKEEVDRQINERVEAERQRFNATQATKISAILATFAQSPDKAREELEAMVRKPPGS
ncbi:MAG: hypothetical protein AAGK09_11165 [Planctomycetota bacterium]